MIISDHFYTLQNTPARMPFFPVRFLLPMWYFLIMGDYHPRRPRGSQSGREKRRDETFQVRAKEPLGTASHRTISKNSSGCRLWLGTKNALYYCAQSANSFSRLLFVSWYTTAIVSPHLPGSFTKLARATTGSPSALCVGLGFRGHLVGIY